MINIDPDFNVDQHCDLVMLINVDRLGVFQLHGPRAQPEEVVVSASNQREGGVANAEVVRLGLEGVVVAETQLSRIDGEAGRLVLRGRSLAELAGRVPTGAGQLWYLLNFYKTNAGQAKCPAASTRRPHGL